MKLKLMPWLIGISISKKAIKDKLNLNGTGIIVQIKEEDNNYRVQQGKVFHVGESFKQPWENRGLPGLEVGDTLIFHHGIERDPENYLYCDDDNDYRIVRHDGHNILAFIKQDGTFVADYNHIWCTDIKVEDKKTESGLFLPANLNTDKHLREQLDDIDDQIKFVSEGSGNVASVTNPLKQHGEKLTRQLNKKYNHPLKMVHINPKLSETRFNRVKVGDTIFLEGWIEYKGYPLNVNGTDYLIVKQNFVNAAIVDGELLPV